MTPQQRADKIATKYMYLPSGMANDIAEAIRDAVAEQFNANDERMAASLKRQMKLRATVAGLERELAEVKEALALSARYIVANDTALGGEAGKQGKGE